METTERDQTQKKTPKKEKIGGRGLIVECITIGCLISKTGFALFQSERVFLGIMTPFKKGFHFTPPHLMLFIRSNLFFFFLFDRPNFLFITCDDKIPCQHSPLMPTLKYQRSMNFFFFFLLKSEDVKLLHGYLYRIHI